MRWLARSLNAVCCLIVAVSACVYAADATGTVRPTCHTLAVEYLAELTRFHGQHGDKVLRIYLGTAWWIENYLNQWTDADSAECTSDGHCEVPVESRVRLERRFGGWAHRTFSGRFYMQFKDGRKIEGSFSAGYVNPNNDFGCE